MSCPAGGKHTMQQVQAALIVERHTSPFLLQSQAANPAVL